MEVIHTLKRAIGLAPEGGYRYRCTDCGREFTYTTELPDPDCPYCDSTDLRTLDEPG